MSDDGHTREGAGAGAGAPDGTAGSFFEDPDLRQRINLLRHLVQATDMVVLVLGERGLGKSRWLRQLQEQSEPRWQFCALDAAGAGDAASLLAALARQCDLPSDCGRPALDYLLADHAAALAREDRVPVAALDDAHTTSPEALRALLMLAMPHADEATAWRVLAFGEPELEDQVARLGLPVELHERLYTVSLPRLSAEQRAGYLALRLRERGWSGSPPWSASDVERTRGVPAALERLAQERTSAAPPADGPPPQSARPANRWWKIGGAVALAFVLAGVLVFQDPINEAVRTDAGSTQEILALPELDEDPLPESEGPPAAEPGIAAPAPSESGASGGDPGPIAATMGGQGVGAAADADPVAEGPPNVAPGEAPEAPPEASSPAPLEPPQATEPPAVTAEQGAPAGPPAQAGDNDVPAPPQASAEAASGHGASQAPPADTASAPSDSPRAWLLSRDPQRYTLQVLGSRTLEAVHSALQRHALSPAAFYTVRYQGRDYHVLVQGDYPNREAARSAIADLPAQLRRGGPWPRRFDEVQQEVRSGRK